MKKTSNTKNKGFFIEEHDRMKAAKYISQFLEKKNNVLWGYIGGFNADILEHFCENTNNKFILGANYKFQCP